MQTEVAKKNKIFTSDSSITSIFFDSIKLELQIKEQKALKNVAGLLRAFYQKRNYRFAWFSEDGVNENTRKFWGLHNNYLNNFQDTSSTYRTFHRDIDAMLNGISPKLPLEKALQTELLLTTHFFVYLTNAYAGKTTPSAMQWYIPRKKLDAVALLQSFLIHNGKDLENWEPVNIFYKRLKRELLHYYEIEKRGGWKIISVDKMKTYQPGDSSLIIKQVKERLNLLYGNIKDSTSYFNIELIPFIKSAEKSFGLKEDGFLGSELIKNLNIPLKTRIDQILINLERMRWLPDQPSGEFIAVNIPEFRLHLFRGETKLFSMNIVVGKVAHNTVIFTDKLQYIVFSPFWNIPASIVRKEIIPAIRKNNNYLAQNSMEQTGTAGHLPVIRQKPGGQNALGRVKFIFPNSYNIYFHDTSSKLLFNQEARAFSHGCMRLADPVKLAYLLRNEPEWTQEEISKAMSLSIEKWVTLKQEVAVYITYFTAWVDSDGLLNFRKDIYSHDKQVAKELFEK